MNIEFTQQEYRTLIELLFYGDWMVQNAVDDPTPETERYAALFKMMKSHAKAMGCESIIAEQDGEFVESEEFVGQLLPIVDEYDSEVFWEELIARLARRDAVMEVSNARFEKMTEEQRFEMIEAKEGRWQDEFGKNGLERLTTNDSSPAQPRAKQPKHDNRSGERVAPKGGGNNKGKGNGGGKGPGNAAGNSSGKGGGNRGDNKGGNAKPPRR